MNQNAETFGAGSWEHMVTALQAVAPPQAIKILMVGDVLGRPGRKLIREWIPPLRKQLGLHFVTINAENLAGGFGITLKTFQEMLDVGVDVLTMGNHWNDKPDVHMIRRNHTQMVLPQNLPDVDGVKTIPLFDIPNTQKKVLIGNLMGNFAMKHQYLDPFAFLQKSYPDLKAKVESGQYLFLMDVHAEASSEKQAMAWYLDGICTALVGTHTHCPTADERITSQGTAFLTDVGMTGPYRSIIGMDVERTLLRYLPPKVTKAHEVAEKDSWLCAFLIYAHPLSGKAQYAARLQYRSESNQWSFFGVRGVES